MKCNALLFSLLLLAATATQAQDSSMVKKPQSKKETMPTRPGRGTAQPMPSPRYGTKITPNPRQNMDKAPIPRDSSRGTMRRDTVR